MNKDDGVTTSEARAASVESAGPPTAKGRRTRAQLLDAARHVFEEKGYLDTRIADIVRAAGVSHGAFYKYFPSKETIFRSVIQELMQQLYVAGSVPTQVPETAVERIEASTRHYIATYRRNARLIAIMEQVATFNSEFGAMRLEIRKKFVSRVEHGIKRFQAQGLADPRLDSAVAARAIASMVGHFAYTWLALGEECNEEVAVATLAALWARGLGIAPPRDGEPEV